MHREILTKEQRSQLAYFKDIDYSEEVIYLKGFKIDDKIIKKKLRDFSLS